MITALLDANVLYPAPLRDLLMQLAVMDLFRAKWSADIHREWIEALLRNEPHRSRAKLERTRDLMDRATRDSLVTDYEHLIDELNLPDSDDRHVLAAAIVGRCDRIITRNQRDFPVKTLNPYDLQTQRPDDFLLELLDDSPITFCTAVRKVRERLKNPPYRIDEYLETLAQQDLPKTVDVLNTMSHLL